MSSPAILRSPEVVFGPRRSRRRPRQAVVWTIDVRPPTIGNLPSDVNIAVRLGRGSSGREANVKRLEDSRFQAEVVPPLPPDESIELNLTVSGDTLRGRTTDRNLQIGDHTYRLSELSRLERLDGGARFRVRTATGKVLTEAVEGLGTVDMCAGERRTIRWI